MAHFVYAPAALVTHSSGQRDGSNWQAVHTEVVAAGVGTFSAYKPQIAVAANAGHTFGLKTDGFRYYRVTWMVDTVTGTPLGYVQYALSGGPI